MSSRDTRRFSGRKFTLVFLTCILLAFALHIARFFATYWPEGPILDEIAEEGDHTLYIRADERGHVHVVREHNTEGPMWTVSVAGVPSTQGITSQGDLTTFRLIDHAGHLETHAFDRVTGEFLWRGGRDDDPFPVGEDATFHQTLVLGDHLFEFDAITGDVICLARSDGATRWREPIEGSAREGGSSVQGERICYQSTEGGDGWCRGAADDERVAFPPAPQRP